MNSNLCQVNKFRAFTLVEILISLAIFSVLSILIFRATDNIRERTKSTELKSERLREVQFAFRQLEDDIRHMVIRERRNEYGDKAALLEGESSGSASYFEFTRADWRNPAKIARSTLQHIRYEFSDEKLERMHWLYVDTALENQQLKRILLKDVENFKVEFLQEESWKDDWLDNDDPLNMPKAIRLTAELKDLGEIVRLFPMARLDEESKNNAREEKSP